MFRSRSFLPYTLAKRDGATMQKTRIKDLMVFEGLGKKKVDEVPCGEICAILGIEGFEIGDTDVYKRQDIRHATTCRRWP